MKAFQLGLFLFGLLSSSYSFSQILEAPNCSNAFVKAAESNCNLTNHHVSFDQNEYWIRFTATSSSLEFITFLNNATPQISEISIYEGTCNNIVLVQNDNSYAIGDTLNLQFLQPGTDYYIAIEVFSLQEFDFKSCIHTKSLDSGIFYFTNQDGVVVECAWTDENYNIIVEQGDSVIGGLYHCDLTFCITDTICITLSTLSSNVTTFPVNFDFLYAFGIPFATSSFNADFTEMCITFNNVGTTNVYADAGHTTDTNPYDSDFDYYGGAIDQMLWSGDAISYMNINVIDQTPPAATNSDGLLCIDDAYTIDGYTGSTIISVSIDNQIVATPNTNDWATFFTSSGTHYIEYTVDGFCYPVTYFDTVEVIQNDTLLVEINPCNLSTFSFFSCEEYEEIQLTFSNGIQEILYNFSGDTSWTYDFSNLTGPMSWTFTGTQASPFFPFPIEITYIQTGIINQVQAQPLLLSGPLFSCELNPNSVAIVNPTLYEEIIWSVDPIQIFSGQGTNSIGLVQTVNPGDIIVTVNTSDSLGCLYEGIWTIDGCCAPIVSNTEFFEGTFVAANGNFIITNLLPDGYYNGPALPIAINLAPAAPIQISTLYSQTTTLSQFVLDNPGIMTGNVISTDQWIFFNNDFIVDQNLTLQFCNHLRFGPGVRIIINSGVTLTINRSTLAPKCDEMWGGIFVNDIDKTLLINGSNIIGAINGVEAVNSSTIDVRASRFIDNATGIFIHDNSGLGSNAIIKSNYFGDVLTLPLLSPFEDLWQPINGVLIEDINGILVGSSDDTGNLFHHQNRGISAERSTISSYRNIFWEINHPSQVPQINQGNLYSGIIANNIGVLGPAKTLTVGGDPSLRNNFVNCEYGVSSNRGMHLYAKFNYMKAVKYRGFSAEENRLRTILIESNQINAANTFGFGIYVKNYPLGNAQIKSNTINMGPNTILQFVSIRTGIYVSSVTPTVFQTTNIEYNTIRNAIYGIWVINTMKTYIQNNTVEIKRTNTALTNLANSGLPTKGILVQNSAASQVLSNTVNRTMGLGDGVANDVLQGIRVELSPAIKVWNNRMYNTAVGFYAYGTNLGSRIDCNQMHFTRNGFYLENADLSDQGAPVNISPYLNGYSAHNAWYNTIGNRTDGNMPFGSMNNYYHASSGSLFSIPVLTLTSNWNDINLTPSNPPFNTCVLALNGQIITLETPSSKRIREVFPIVQGIQLYDSLDYQQKHFLKLVNYSRLVNDSSVLILNQSDDTTYINYVTENYISNTQTKILYDSQKAFNDDNYSMALSLNSQLSDSCNQYNTNKIVQNIWINSKLNNAPIIASDSSILLEIACSDPLIYGSGVYQARAILDWDGLCNSANNKLMNIEIEKEVINEDEIILYPNPTNGSFQIKSTIEIKSFEVFSLSGTLVLSKILFKSSEQYFDLSLTKGIYLINMQLISGSSIDKLLVIE